MDNLRGSILMVLAMLGFALEDMFMKQMANALPTGQILAMLGLGGGLIFAIVCWVQGQSLLARDVLHPMVLLRNFGEVFGTVGYVSAVILTPISSASAIFQATPLFVTLGAALFLQESVGWRRWVAIAVGFCGVLLIIRPGLDSFQPASLFAVQGVIFLGIRDLATRRIPRSISSMRLSTYAFAVIVPTGLVLMAVMGDSFAVPSGTDSWRIAGSIAAGVLGYYALVTATRLGDMSHIAPFRYSRLVFALIVGTTVFGERPDLATLIGAAIIVGSGTYAAIREGQRRRASLAAAGAI
ncbi:MAG: drug/metabolite transporter (DMT)-like permease [Loktanella salsilacus]|mgnify:FL=1|uniref:Permease of the drug/metabolite transporter (DMT) superfamily n=1 Tax=Loktanella salsilacus TaxID=195913 RepID=A0A1I4CBB9_9RHOB|nr:DMT family transporter [Loktanella salsilacus]MBU0782080.1 DMT family transporter [Alphaproteobacteria bacterium]MBU1835973.1 DMT family transporter [Alphaproteobacteria bacterium]SFK77920.1 Permease of the drug/metabolite transporter (DMT) superfamily [Loktanella salsilacus]